MSIVFYGRDRYSGSKSECDQTKRMASRRKQLAQSRESQSQKVRVGDRPQTHEEYIAPGYVATEPHYYMLRPEAIEPVWYLYRLTGDRAWMDKSWAMFERVEHATRARNRATARSKT